MPQDVFKQMTIPNKRTYVYTAFGASLRRQSLVDTLAVMAKPKTENARIASVIMLKARVVAARRNKSVPDLLNEVLGPIMDSLYDEEFAAMAKERADAPKRKSRDS